MPSSLYPHDPQLYLLHQFHRHRPCLLRKPFQRKKFHIMPHFFCSLCTLICKYIRIAPSSKTCRYDQYFFAIINQLRFLQKISGFYQMGLHPDYRKDLYEQPLELLAAFYWMCTCCP